MLLLHRSDWTCHLHRASGHMRERAVHCLPCPVLPHRLQAVQPAPSRVNSSSSGATTATSNKSNSADRGDAHAAAVGRAVRQCATSLRALLSDPELAPRLECTMGQVWLMLAARMHALLCTAGQCARAWHNSYRTRRQSLTHATRRVRVLSPMQPRALQCVRPPTDGCVLCMLPT
jgi:hypothetical protein